MKFSARPSLYFAVSFAVLSVAGLVAYSQGSGGTIYGCYKQQYGQLRVVSNVSECLSSETAITWSSGDASSALKAHHQDLTFVVPAQWTPVEGSNPDLVQISTPPFQIPKDIPVRVEITTTGWQVEITDPPLVFPQKPTLLESTLTLDSAMLTIFGTVDASAPSLQDLSVNGLVSAGGGDSANYSVVLTQLPGTTDLAVVMQTSAEGLQVPHQHLASDQIKVVVHLWY